MERQKGRLTGDLARARKDFNAIVEKLAAKLKATEVFVDAAVAERDSKKFKKAHETAKKQQRELEAVLDKVFG